MTCFRALLWPVYEEVNYNFAGKWRLGTWVFERLRGQIAVLQNNTTKHESLCLCNRVKLPAIPSMIMTSSSVGGSKLPPNG
ncbi:hypothetical protein D6C79_04817 [Aureobasidium pullulans]|nr:hypothetical protein D6C79_04817 [Aureobasidium pullulans]